MAVTVSTSALRARRLQCGLTQAELATRAGVSRQLVAAVEAGQNAPSVDAALKLARALATTVEALFGEPAGGWVPVLGEGVREGVPLRVGRVGGRLVAGELADHGVAGAGWASPDGVVQAGELRLFAGAAPDGLVIAGCDPALGVAEAMLRGLGSRSAMAISATTGAALGALREGRLHAAVVHGPATDLPDPPVPVMRLHLAAWQVGLGVTAGLSAPTLDAVLEAGMPVVGRDPAAASQQAFERAAARAGHAAVPAGPRAGGHIEAARLAAMLAGAGVTHEAAARAFGLQFLALEAHQVEIWLDRRWLEHPGVSALGELLAARAFTDRVAQFGGYDLSRCGARLDG